MQGAVALLLDGCGAHVRSSSPLYAAIYITLITFFSSYSAGIICSGCTRRKEKTNPRERRGCEKIRENMLSINLQLGKFSMTSTIGSQT
jgi:hypothetical protein